MTTLRAAVKPQLTVGMACYDDYMGVFFTLQSLRLHHAEAMPFVELLVVDNNPDSKHGKLIKELVKHIPGGRYEPFREYASPMVKGRVMELANTPYAMCMDAHVLLPPGTLSRLIDFFNNQSNERDFYQGPLLYDNLQSVATHFDPIWRGQMFGTWGCDDRGRLPDSPPFEIPMQGMGLFACQTKAWPGFNPLFRGFGGEEGYIHEKVRQRGGKCWCLPFLRWNHRFNNPYGVPYPLTMEAKVRNYFIGWLELGMPTEPIVQHFSKWRPANYWRQLLDKTRKEMSLVASEPVRHFVAPQTIVG